MIKHNNFNKKHILVVFGLVLVFGTLFGSLRFIQSKNSQKDTGVSECDSDAGKAVLATAYKQLENNDNEGLKSSVETIKTYEVLNANCLAVVAAYHARTGDDVAAEEYINQAGDNPEVSEELNKIGVTFELLEAQVRALKESKSVNEDWNKYMWSEDTEGGTENAQ